MILSFQRKLIGLSIFQPDENNFDGRFLKLNCKIFEISDSPAVLQGNPHGGPMSCFTVLSKANSPVGSKVLRLKKHCF